MSESTTQPIPDEAVDDFHDAAELADQQACVCSTLVEDLESLKERGDDADLDEPFPIDIDEYRHYATASRERAELYVALARTLQQADDWSTVINVAHTARDMLDIDVGSER